MHVCVPFGCLLAQDIDVVWRDGTTARAGAVELLCVCCEPCAVLLLSPSDSVVRLVAIAFADASPSALAGAAVAAVAAVASRIVVPASAGRARQRFATIATQMLSVRLSLHAHVQAGWQHAVTV